MAWVYLILAGIFEWGWPVGLKFGWTEAGLKAGPLALAVISMAASGALLLLSLREIPIGTAYAVWTGIGAVGTFLLGILFFGDPSTLGRYVFVAFILVGIIGLKLVSAPTP
ncbi:MAG: multidrug efflux SMR transporter [Alphaproteobacteria bacterium]|nr:multidrug efflux SMR transporter [Alphaproteobacteria bacterium]